MTDKEVKLTALRIAVATITLQATQKDSVVSLAVDKEDERKKVSDELLRIADKMKAEIEDIKNHETKS